MATSNRWRAIAVGAIALSAASLAANVGLFEVGQHYYAHEQDVRLDPIGLSIHEAERKAAPDHAKPVVAMFGDSRVAMWSPPSIEGYDVVNLGIGYQTTEQALLRFDADVAPLHPRVVLIQVGVNDLKTLPLFPSKRDRIVGDCKANIRTIVAKSTALGARVILTTIFSLGDVPFYRRVVWAPAATAAAIDEVNDFVRSLAGPSVTIVESSRILDEPNGKVKPAFQFDYLHENGAAYAALDADVVALIAAGAASPASAPPNRP